MAYLYDSHFKIKTYVIRSCIPSIPEQRDMWIDKGIWKKLPHTHTQTYAFHIHKHI